MWLLVNSDLKNDGAGVGKFTWLFFSGSLFLTAKFPQPCQRGHNLGHSQRFGFYHSFELTGGGWPYLVIIVLHVGP